MIFELMTIVSFEQQLGPDNLSIVSSRLKFPMKVKFVSDS